MCKTFKPENPWNIPMFHKCGTFRGTFHIVYYITNTLWNILMFYNCGTLWNILRWLVLPSWIPSGVLELSGIQEPARSKNLQIFL